MQFFRSNSLCSSAQRLNGFLPIPNCMPFLLYYCALGCVSVYYSWSIASSSNIPSRLQKSAFAQPFDHSVCIFSWSFVLTLCFTAAAVNLVCWHSEEQNRSISSLWIKPLGPSTDDALLMAVCLNGMQNVTSVHRLCRQPPVILFHQHCNSCHQSHLYDSIPHNRLGSLPYISHKIPVAKQDLITLSSAGTI